MNTHPMDEIIRCIGGKLTDDTIAGYLMNELSPEQRRLVERVVELYPSVADDIEEMRQLMEPPELSPEPELALPIAGTDLAGLMRARFAQVDMPTTGAASDAVVLRFPCGPEWLPLASCFASPTDSDVVVAERLVLSDGYYLWVTLYDSPGERPHVLLRTDNPRAAEVAIEVGSSGLILTADFEPHLTIPSNLTAEIQVAPPILEAFANAYADASLTISITEST